jgi:teichuronic acid exporter
LNIKAKTIKGLRWSFIENLANQLILFIFGIILARILQPNEFGLTGILSIFISVASVFVYSGFGEALIRKDKIISRDYSTVFFFNLCVSLFFYLFLFSLARGIAGFFNEPQLLKISRVFWLVLIIDAFGLVPRTILTKNIDFKSLAKVSLISSITSGIIGVILAIKGYGVWSLVIRTILQSSIRTLMLWVYCNWRLSFTFSTASFKEMFGFSYKIMISSFINQMYLNLNQFIIGRFYSSAQLGFYNRANQFQSIAGSQLDNTTQRVTYPVLSEIQNDQERLKRTYKKLIKGTMFISFATLIGMSAVASQLILTLVGEKWVPSIIYLRLLCFAGMLYPLHSLNLNILNVKGRSDLFLKLEIIKKTLAIPAIIIGIFIGIKEMIFVMIINSIIAYFINSYYSGRLINYPVKEQLADILPVLLLTSLMGLVVFEIGDVLRLKADYELIIQITLGVLLISFFAWIFKFESFLELKNIVSEAFKS